MRRRLEPTELSVDRLFPMDGHNFVVAFPRCADCKSAIPPRTPYYSASCSGYARDVRGRRHHRKRTRYICVECKQLREAFLAARGYEAELGSETLFLYAAEKVSKALAETDDAAKQG